MSPALLLALALQADPAGSQLDDLKRAYEQSCTVRAYGAFDDVCTQMGDQIRAYERESRKAAARRPAASAPPPTATPVKATGAAPALVAAAPPDHAQSPPAR